MRQISEGPSSVGGRPPRQSALVEMILAEATLPYVIDGDGQISA
ncbi:MAG: hypothetical protein ACRD0B_12570 [Acidimicrobiales bacterium]